MIEQGFYELLLNEPTVTDIVGDRIFAVMLPDGHSLPAITFSRIATEPIQSFDGDNETEVARYQFDLWAKRYFDTVRLRQAVRSLLVPKSDGSSTTPANNYTLPDGTRVQAAQIHADDDLPYEISGTGVFVFRRMLDIRFIYVPA